MLAIAWFEKLGTIISRIDRRRSSGAVPSDQLCQVNSSAFSVAGAELLQLNIWHNSPIVRLWMVGRVVPEGRGFRFVAKIHRWPTK